ncbi:MAG: 23S rRNA (adenine(2503)-C(2))-methyltransferase RlmN [Clostridia bacterium]|nr:23S rRNA (adenine(2503)-C(2))-methyltransferase RlmN [Clostridia bacterium]
MVDLKSLTMEEMKAFVLSLGEKPFRAKQIFKWVYRGAEICDMTDLSKDLREKLLKNACVGNIQIEERLISKDGTRKYLFKLSDGNFIESVFMKYKHGNTICVSSQAGCAMGCRFCASTIDGFSRNLTPSEIIDQIMKTEEDTGEKISNIVMMGIGEPLANFENVIKFLENVNAEDGLNIGYRHISLSTCGLADKIRDLADINIPITLSVSLHSPFNEKRSDLMPVNKKFPIPELISAMRYYLEKTGRRISIEYAMIEGENDTKECANELVRLFSDMLCHVNLIPVNKVKERDYKKTSADKIEAFKNKLCRMGLNTTVRRSLGSDINAACGQLRKNRMNNENLSD